MKMTLIRHGHSVNNYLRAARPHEYEEIRHYDAPLTMLGRIQSKLLGREVCRGVKVIYTSDMSRAIETAIYMDQRVEIIPIPYFAEIGHVAPTFNKDFKHNVYTDKWFNSNNTLNIVNAWSDDIWAHSNSIAGDYDKCSSFFRSVVLKWIINRHSSGDLGGIVIIGHGKFLRYLCDTFLRLENTGLYDVTVDDELNISVLNAINPNYAAPAPLYVIPRKHRNTKFCKFLANVKN